MKRKSVFILKGNIVYSKNQKEFSICENGYVVCKDGIVEGVYKTLPFKFGGNPIRDYKDALHDSVFADYIYIFTNRKFFLIFAVYNISF